MVHNRGVRPSSIGLERVSGSVSRPERQAVERVSPDAATVRRSGHAPDNDACTRSRLGKGMASTTESAPLTLGPGSRPLFYTALPQQPGRLSWIAIPNTSVCRVTLGITGGDGVLSPLWSELAHNTEGYTWNVPDLALTPGTLYTWRVDALDEAQPPSAESPAEGEDRIDLSGREARFWLIGPEENERLRDGLRLIQQRADPPFVALAEAMFIAEFQLYHHALIRVQRGTDGASAHVRNLLAETVRSVIFRQMTQHIRQSGDLPPCFCEWASGNEQFHRQRADAQIPEGRAPRKIRPSVPSGAGRSTRSTSVPHMVPIPTAMQELESLTAV